jgi:hypothetical protein
MVQSGITDYLKQKYWPKESKCDAGKNEAQGPSALDLKGIQGAFFFLGLGLIAALLVLFAEVAYDRWKSRKQAQGGDAYDKSRHQEPRRKNLGFVVLTRTDVMR